VRFDPAALTRLREEKGWNQSELARRSGVDRATVSRLESGKSPDPSAITIALIAMAFGDGELRDPTLRQLFRE